MDTAVRRMGYFAYIVNPNTTTFQHPSQVPDYVSEAVPFFMLFSVLELGVRWLVDRQHGYSQFLENMGHGILHEVTRIVVAGLVLFGYEWLYQYRLWEWQWDSLNTWLATVVLVDFCYYWIHRANHELNILWAVHQVHHSSEDYNFTAALRSSAFQKLAHFGFYQPLALVGIPFPAVIVHSGFNLVAQFWVHNTFIGRLGPLEYIISTPAFHRIHHGANKWCLDKNYAGVFVLWDIIFGTFQLEPHEPEDIVYGLTSQPQTHNAMYAQFFHFRDLINKARSMTTWKDSLKAIFYGPGWSPGTPRLGDPSNFPEVTSPREKYDPQPTTWKLCYVGSHLTVAIFLQQLMATHFMPLTWAMVAFIFASVGVVTSILDGWRWAGVAEAARCTVYVLNARTALTTHSPLLDSSLIMFFTLCAVLWTCHGLAPTITNGKKEKLY